MSERPRLVEFARCAGCAGKFPQGGTAEIVRGLARFDDPNLIVGAEGFSDAGVYRLRDDLLLVQSVDFFPPLIDDPFIFGQIAAANALSDLFAMGADAVTALNIVAFPESGLDLSVLGDILRGAADRVKMAGAVVVGGHTVRDEEVKFGQAVTGVVTPDRLLRNNAARPGDVLVLTKALGTGFTTTAAKKRRCPEAVLATAIESMIQLNIPGRDAAHAVGAKAATDVTGFGLAGHAGELAAASGVTAVIDLHRLPLLPGIEPLITPDNRTRASTSNRAYAEPTTRLELDLDPLRLEILFDPQTSGGLLLSVPADRADELVNHARRAGAPFATVIGSVDDRLGETPLIIRP